MSPELNNLARKASYYKDIVRNARKYRSVWTESLRDAIVKQLETVVKEVELDATVEVKGELENLEAIVLSFGDVKSGMYQMVSDDIKRHMIKHNGSLIYQQLFNGKVIVMINFPYIENYGQPNPPKTIGIYRPEELKSPFILRHLEEFIQELTNWEDYDDDQPNETQKIGFHLNFNQDVEE